MKKTNKDEADFVEEIVPYEPEVDAPLHEDPTCVPAPINSRDQAVPESQDDKSSRRALLAHQLNRVARESSVGGLERRADLKKGTVALYQRLAPRDAIDTMLASLMVGIHNQTMDCIAQSGVGFASGQPIKLQYSIKGAKMFVELTEAYAARRGGARRNVTVGTVNVEQGGNAIVGNVEAGARRRGSSSGNEEGS